MMNVVGTEQGSVKGIITDIQRFSVNDGPGIRTVVFMKGCPLHCLWCQNPETQKKEIEIAYFSENCIKCGSCIQACGKNALTLKNDRIVRDKKRCIECGACVCACKYNSMKFFGKMTTDSEVAEVLLRDKVFYQKSGGGITLSGGEPLLQSTFSISILEKMQKEKINTAIETSGFSKWDEFLKVLEKTDLLLFDLKHTNEEVHNKFTGVSNKLIIENLYKAVRTGVKTVMRVPLIPKYNMNRDNITNLIEIANANGIKYIHILPFHQMGRPKWKAVDMSYACDDLLPPTEENIEAIEKQFKDNGLIVNIGGYGSYP